ncbi:MAG: phosphatidate cytidylyltransferase [Deltaproteobacteria bacterium]|nr:phosphatidate cytidylyltransferase [Deltaproteobacteria bacterium]
MHLKRWITAVVALPFLILLILKGGPLTFAVFICIVCTLAFWEYHRIVFDKSEGAAAFGFQLSAYITGPLIILSAYLNSFRFILILLSINFIFSALVTLVRFKSDARTTEKMTKQIAGIIYIALSLSLLVLIRNGTDGIIWIFFLLIVVFAGDIGAYYAGTTLGRHKLCPSVSPGKTIEGSIGGLAANIGAGALFMHFFLPSLPWGAGIVFFLAAGAAGQAGDLFESTLKRAGDIKDSGGILPGHGGILDRIDALLFATPVAYLFKEFILK